MSWQEVNGRVDTPPLPHGRHCPSQEQRDFEFWARNYLGDDVVKWMKTNVHPPTAKSGRPTTGKSRKPAPVKSKR